MTKLHLPPGTARSKVYELTMQLEASYIAAGKNEDSVLTVRMEDGRWVRLSTWVRRAEALGLKLDDVWKSVRAGEHPVGL